jgi:iron complex outermembrane receptor protein
MLPEVRLAWKPSSRALLWGSVERAVRSPTPFDEEVRELAPPIISLSGNPQFVTEKLWSFELGTRVQPTRTLSLSATAFYHRYDDLRTIELATGPLLLNLTWGNNLRGSIYGIEAWADVQVARWWKVSAGGTWLQHDLHFKPGAAGLLGTSQDGNDPPYVAALRSTMTPLTNITFEVDARAVGALRASSVPAYEELDSRLAWQVTPAIALAVSGTNLLHDRHQEYPDGDYIPRRVTAGLELRY